jgi:hypothetical protein
VPVTSRRSVSCAADASSTRERKGRCTARTTSRDAQVARWQSNAEGHEGREGQSSSAWVCWWALLAVVSWVLWWLSGKMDTHNPSKTRSFSVLGPRHTSGPHQAASKLDKAGGASSRAFSSGTHAARWSPPLAWAPELVASLGLLLPLLLPLLVFLPVVLPPFLVELVVLIMGVVAAE